MAHHTTTDGRPTVEILLAPGSSIDGGPFWQEQVAGYSGDRVRLAPISTDPASRSPTVMPSNNLAELVRECLFNEEPMLISLTPCDGPRGHAGPAVGVDLPLDRLARNTEFRPNSGGSDEIRAWQIRTAEEAGQLAHKLRRHGGQIEQQ